MWASLKTEVVVTIGGLFGVGSNVLGVVLGRVKFVDDIHTLGMSLLSGAVGVVGAYAMNKIIMWVKVRKNASKAKRITLYRSIDGDEKVGDIHTNSK
jgi:hypothetical protein